MGVLVLRGVNDFCACKRNPHTENVLLDPMVLCNGTVCGGGFLRVSSERWKPSSGLGGKGLWGFVVLQDGAGPGAWQEEDEEVEARLGWMV